MRHCAPVGEHEARIDVVLLRGIRSAVRVRECPIERISGEEAAHFGEARLEVSACAERLNEVVEEWMWSDEPLLLQR
jgi:hypothetical protein